MPALIAIVIASSVCLVALTTWAVVAARRQQRRAPRVPVPSPPVNRVRALSAANPLEGLGARLRAAREERAVTIAQVSSATKIKGTLIAGLERGDLTGWPPGLFRRAFVKEYARAIGLDPERVFAEFSWIHTDPAAADVMVERRSRPRVEVPRLALSDGRSVWMHDARLRLVYALGDVSLVALGAGWLSLAFGVDVTALAAIAAFVCYPLSLIAFGETAASRAHRWLSARITRSGSESGLRLVLRPERVTPRHTALRTSDAAESQPDHMKAASG